jgi:hypothetical protein
MIQRLTDPRDRTPEPPPPSVIEAAGGPLGMAETALPGLAFVVAYTVSGQDTNLSAYVALGLAVVLAAARLARRETPRHALSGLFGVALAAFIATRSGKAENFFLPGLIFNAGYAAAFAISVLVRWPLVGYLVTQLDGTAKEDWRSDRPRMRVFNRASWMWSGLFVVRLAVQLPLYLAGAVVALGVARTAMGLPLFALGVWLSYLMVRRVPAQSP